MSKVFKVDLFITKDQAEQTLKTLQNEAKKLRVDLAAAQQAGDTKQIKDLNKQITALDKSMAGIKKSTFDYDMILRNLNGSTMNELNRASKALYLQMRGLVPATKEYAQCERSLKKVNDRIKELKDSYASMAKIKPLDIISADVIAKWGAKAVSVVKDAAAQAAQLDDVYADVMKTTGLTHELVEKLNEEFKKMDTRTSREELNMLARDAGKLGITGSENIEQFVRAADKINVALGEELGEGAIRNIGKISDVFKLTDSLGIEKAYLSIGSAINSLGQASTASEGYLVDFAQRLSGMGAQAGISVQNILGFASAMDQSGVRVEMGATAFQKFIMNMYSDTATFAKYANMEVSQFAELLEKDANTAIITVLKSLNESGGFGALVPIFKDMGADGARAVSALSAVATNITAVTEAQQLSNDEFTKATSIEQEYTTKNSNLQAQLEKSQKRLKESVVTLGQKFVPLLIKTNQAVSAGAGFVMKYLNVITPFSVGILLAATRVKMLSFWQNIVNLSINVWNKAAGLGKITTLLFAKAMAKLQGNTSKAAAAQKMLSATLASTGWGAVIVAIGAAISAVTLFVNKINEPRKAMKEFYAETQKLKNEADLLFDVLEKNAAGSNLYTTALEKLKEQYGPYIEHLIDEKGCLTDIAAARKIVNSEIERSVALKLQEEAVSSLTEKALKKQAADYERIVSRIRKAYNVGEESARMLATQVTAMLKEGKSKDDIFTALFGGFGDWSTAKGNLSAAMSGFSSDYSNFIADLNKTKSKFSGLFPSTLTQAPSEGDDEFIGPLRKKEEAIIESNNNINDANKDAYERELANLDSSTNKALNLLKKSYLEKEITQEEYQAKSEALNIDFLTQRNALCIQFNQDNASAESAMYDALIKQQEKAAKRLDDIHKALKKGDKAFKDTLADIEKETSKTIDKLNEEIEFDVDWSEYEELLKHASQIRSELADKDINARYEKEKAALKKLLDENLISEESYQAKLKDIKLDYAKNIASVISTFTQSVADLTSAIQDSELQKLEAQKAQELTLYGDTADKRAEIENKYEKKKLEVQKKYADIDMAVKIAQTIAAGALAAIQAYAQGGPYAGPVLAAIVAATTAVQIATIVAQRNALRNSSVDSSSSSSTTIGSRDLTGFSSGGYTDSDSSDLTPVGVVHANEWVAPAAMVRSYPAVFASLERKRLQGTRITSIKGFASGGYTSSGNTQSGLDAKLVEQLTGAIEKLTNTPLQAYTILSEQTKKQEMIQRFKKASSK